MLIISIKWTCKYCSMRTFFSWRNFCSFGEGAFWSSKEEKFSVSDLINKKSKKLRWNALMFPGGGVNVPQRHPLKSSLPINITIISFSFLCRLYCIRIYHICYLIVLTVVIRGWFSVLDVVKVNDILLKLILPWECVQ